MSNLETRLESLESEVHGAQLTRAGRTLDQLGLFYFILAGISGLFSMIPILHVVMGFAMMFAPSRPGEPSPAIFGGIFVGIGLFCITLGLCYSALLVIAGRNLKARTRPTLVTVAAALSCFNMPFGTALGIYTLIEMNKDEVRNLFKKTL